MRRLGRLVLSVCAVASFWVVATPGPASACVPPNCPGFGACHVNKDAVSVGDDGTIAIDPRLIECYY